MPYISNNPNINGSITTYSGTSDFTSKKMLRFEIQRFDTDEGLELKKVGLEVLNVFGKILVDFGLVKLAQELEDAKDATEWLTKNTNPVLKFIGATKFGKGFANYAKLITNSISILDNTLAIVKGDLPDATRNSKIGSIAGSLEAMADATNKLMKDNSNDNLWFLSIVSAGISLTASLIAGMDGVTEKEQEKINRSYIIFMKTLGSDLVKKFFNDAFEKQISRAFTESVTDDLLADIFKKGKFFKNAAPVFLKAFNGIMTFGTGILNGYSKYNNNLEKYLEDGIPEDIAKHDAFIDALAKFTKETMSGIVFGVDDVIFSFAKWVTSGLGIEYAEDSNKDYIETLIYKTKIKTLNYTNTGLSTDDAILFVLENGVMLYGDSGNDNIENFGFSHATIWGGHDDDTIHSYTIESAAPQQNSIFGGPGNDKIAVYDKNSTVFGGSDDDSIFVAGTNNQIFGDAGNDSVYLYTNANENTVSGGTGDDVVFLLEDTKNALIKYAAGDGNDTIYYFDENDAFSISSAYKVSTVDSDIKISVGSGSMLLRGAAGKTIKINGKTIKSGGSDDDTSTVTISPPNFPTMPSIVESPFIYGTDADDRITNDKDRVLIFSGSGNDSIENSGDSVKIDGGDGDDTIDNEVVGSNVEGGSNVTIDGGAGNDSIENDGIEAIISGGAGDDSIYNWAESVLIYGDEGNDRIFSSGSNMTINTGADDDVILNGGYIDNNGYYSDGGSNVLINSGLGNDSIYNEGDSVIINGGDGDDTIRCDNWSNDIAIYGGTGNDSILSELTGFVTIDGGAGYDTIFVNGHDIKIFGGTGNDFITNEESNDVTINAGEGNDSIHNIRKWRASINGNEGNDVIFNESCNYVTIIGGTGNDSIKNSGDNVLFQYTLGDGNDTIYGFKLNSTLQIVGGNYSTIVSGNDVLINVGEGAIMLKDVKESSLSIQGTLGTGGDEEPATVGATINNTDSGVTLQGTANKDSLTNYGGDEVLITADADADTIFSYGDSVTIEAGAGDDIIDDAGINSVIDGGAGKDRISLAGGGLSGALTVSGGLGDDTIYGDISAHIYRYASGDGNDTIFGFNSDDTLYISTGNISSASVSGEDVVLKIGSGSVNLKAAKAQSIRIKNASGTVLETIIGGDSEETLPPDTDTLPAGISISGATLTVSTTFTDSKIDLADYATTVTKVNASALSRGISIVGTATDNSLKGGKGADTISGGAGNDTVSLGGGADVYVYESGNDLIQDYTASADKIKLASATVNGSSLSGSNVVLKTSAGNIIVKNGKGKNITLIDAAGKETTQIYPSVASEPTLSSGLTYDAKKTAVTLASSFSGTLKAADYASTVKKIDATKISKSINIVGNSQANTIIGSSKAETIYGGTGNDSIIGGGGNDKLYGEAGADTLYGGAGADTLNGGDGKDVFVYANGDGADVIVDFTAGQDSIKLTSGTVISASLKGLDMVFKIGSGSLTVKNGKGKEISVGSTVYYNNLVYDAKKTAVTLASSFSGSFKAADYASSVKKIDASAASKSVNIVGNTQANTIIGGGKAETIYGGIGNDSIIGGAGNDKLYGEAGADTLYGGTGADTLTGGDGKDVFVYANGDGADVIADFTTDQDSIKLTSGTVASASLKGSDMVLKIGNGSLTIKNGKGKEISVGSSIYYNNFVYDTKKTTVTLASGFTGSLKTSDYASTVKKIDASIVSKSVNLVGNDQANTIIGGSKSETIYGGKGNDSINGGAGNDRLYGETGNDTLWGGAGNDTFVYGTGDGKDVIADYTAGDTIKISSGTITATGYKSNDVVFTVGSGTLTVKNGKGKAITITDASNKTSTKTYTTDVTYGSNGIRNSNALWFTEDDTNFISGTNLDAISSENYAVTNLEAASVDTLVMNDSLSSVLTFTVK